MDTALNRIKRKLEAAELIHLRQHCNYLAERLEIAEERAMKSEEQADWYWQEWHNLIDQMMEEGEEIGLTKDGQVVSLTPSSGSLLLEMLIALEVAERFMAGFEDDDSQENIKGKLFVIRSAISAAKGES